MVFSHVLFKTSQRFRQLYKTLEIYTLLMNILAQNRTHPEINIPSMTLASSHSLVMPGRGGLPPS